MWDKDEEYHFGPDEEELDFQEMLIADAEYEAWLEANEIDNEDLIISIDDYEDY